MENKDIVLIIMRDEFLLGLYKTAFSAIENFHPVGFIREDTLIRRLKSIKPKLIVLEKNLCPAAYKILINKANSEQVPVLILTKEEQDKIKKDLANTICDQANIMSDDLIDIVKRGRILVKNRKAQ